MEKRKVLIHDTSAMFICPQETRLYQSHAGFSERFHRCIEATLHLYRPLNITMQAVTINIPLSLKMTIFSLSSNYRFVRSELIDQIAQLPAPFLLVGDFNAIYTFTSSRKLNWKYTDPIWICFDLIPVPPAFWTISTGSLSFWSCCVFIKLLLSAFYDNNHAHLKVSFFVFSHYNNHLLRINATQNDKILPKN